MLIGINIGNTRTLCATITEGEVNDKIYFYTHSELSQLKKFLTKISKDTNFERVIITSVVPSATKLIADFVEKSLNREPLIVRYSYIKEKVSLQINNAKNLSTDRISNMIGAIKQYGNGLIVVDMGTATTFDIIDHSGNYIGGIIAAGLFSQLESLADSLTLMPDMEVRKPYELISTDIIESMKSGVFWGYISMVEGIIERIRGNSKDPLKVVATGGVLSLVLDEVTKIDYKDSELLIKGLIEIYRLIGKKYDAKFKRI
jgi:type III pantothenate kinase